MKKYSLAIIASAWLMAGCSQSVPPAEKLDTTVGQLNRSLSHLSEQSEALAFQHRMNAASDHGAWLLSQANSPVELLSPHARLILQLVPQISAGSVPLLEVKNAGTDVLPAFELTAVQSVISGVQQDPISPPPPQSQQILRQITPLAPGAQARFVLKPLPVNEQQFLLVNIHQFRAIK